MKMSAENTVTVLTPSDWTFQLSALIFSPIPESLVAVIIRSKTPTGKQEFKVLFKSKL